ncbi:MAG: pyridoxamine 5'-phosphate oxidase family protein [Chloroflexi bacterium]|nr:pyridoxamine 5'-phosphate oxidase family protein [Chloroflexota bacterium]
MEVSMGKLTEETKQFIKENGPGLIATASKSGRPNVSPKGSTQVLDDDNIIFAHVRSPRTFANIKENPQVAILCFNSATRKGVRVWGKAEVLNSGAIYDKMAAQYAARTPPVKVQSVIKVAVDQVEALS